MHCLCFDQEKVSEICHLLYSSLTILYLFTITDYGCSCERGYRGRYCDNSHLLAWEIVLIIGSVAGIAVFAVLGVVTERRCVSSQNH